MKKNILRLFPKFILFLRFAGALVCIVVALKLLLMTLAIWGVIVTNQTNFILLVLVYLLVLAQVIFADLEKTESHQ